MNIVPDVILTGENPGDAFGIYVSGAGDVNNEGFDDVIVSAILYNSNLGRAYIYFCGPAMVNVTNVIMTGEANSYFGYSVSTAGDINGDGFSEIIIGAHSYSSFTGRVYIYYGGGGDG